MHRSFIRCATLIGALSVILGAFAAHSLKGSISNYAVEIFETGVRYQFYHAFALLAAGILWKEFPNKFIQWAGVCFIIGIILFSGSLYCLTYIKGSVLPDYNWIGAITPIGGLSFIGGWVLLFIGSFKKQKSVVSDQ